MPANHAPGIAIVSAAAGGIGLAIVERLRVDGFHVVGLDVSVDAIAALKDRLPTVQWHVCDIADDKAVADTWMKIDFSKGPLSVLINNAGIAGPTALVEDISVNEWDRTLSVNLTGAFHLTKRAVPPMKNTRQGAIINIITSSLKVGLPRRLAYIASKGGLLAMTETLARELGPYGVTCNAISPGMVDNERGRAVLAEEAQQAGMTLQDFEEQSLRYISMRCWIEPSEIAAAVAFLTSREARHITNQHISVCGNAEWE
jgi:NAD(P)-dependent dehydrogenase (short-subunit alcohol dehydrogenase family)